MLIPLIRIGSHNNEALLFSNFTVVAAPAWAAISGGPTEIHYTIKYGVICITIVASKELIRHESSHFKSKTILRGDTVSQIGKFLILSTMLIKIILKISICYILFSTVATNCFLEKVRTVI